MVKSYLPLRSIDKKTGKPTGPILMAEIVKNKPKNILSYTVIWNKNTCPNDIIKSYFYGFNLLDVCSKFYYDKYELDYMITSILQNPES